MVVHPGMQPASGLGTSARLRRHPVFETTDVAVAEREVSGLYKPLDMKTPLANQFSAAVNSAPLGSTQLSYFAFSESVFIDCPELDDCYVVNLALERSVMPVTHRGTRTVAAADTAVVFGPSSPCVVQFIPEKWRYRHTVGQGRPFKLLSVRLDAASLTRHLSRMLGAPVRQPVRFDVEFDLRGPDRWRPTLAWALELLEREGDLSSRPLVAVELDHAIYTTLLLTQRHNYTDQLFSDQPRESQPGVVGRARERIEAAPEDPHTVTSVAEAEGVSTRTLQAEFRKHLGMSPSYYIRSVRLERAHCEIERQPADSTTSVTEIALRWGFGHTGRFAKAYRDRYGVAPSDALRQARRRNG